MNPDRDLFDACANGNIIKVKELLQYPEININCECRHLDSSYSPLAIACQNGHVAIITVLLSNPKINVNQQNIAGETALHAATRNFSNTVETVQLLLHAPAIDVNARDSCGYSPFHAACCENNVDMVNLLQADPRVDILTKSLSGKTALWITHLQGNDDIVFYFLKYCLSHHECNLNLENPRILLENLYHFFGLNDLSILSSEDEIEIIFHIKNPSSLTLDELDKLLNLAEMEEHLDAPGNNDIVVTALALPDYDISLSYSIAKIKQWLEAFNASATAECFALMVFLCDGYLTLKEEADVKSPLLLLSGAPFKHSNPPKETRSAFSSEEDSKRIRIEPPH